MNNIGQLIPKNLQEMLGTHPFLRLLKFSYLNEFRKRLKMIRRASALILVLLILGYFIRKNRQRSIIQLFKTNSKNSEILSKLEPILNRYAPSFYLPFAQIMIMSQVFKNPSCPPFVKEILQFDDGTELLIEWSVRREAKEDAPIVAFILGTAGVSSDSYSRAFVKAVTDKGWRLVVVNRIGFGYQNVRTRRFLGKDEHENFNIAISKIHQKYPQAPMFLVGVSSGANQAALYLGHHPNTPVRAAVTIGNPYNLCRVSYFMPKLYSWILAHGMKKLYRFHMKNPLFMNAITEHYSDPDVVYNKFLSGKTTAWKIEKNLSSKLSMAESIFDYYNCMSSESVLDRIKVPLLAINSLDDPVCSKHAIPVEKIISNENIIALLFERGGHVEFFHGWRSEWFGFDLAVQYFDLLLKTDQEKNESVGAEIVSPPS